MECRIQCGDCIMNVNSERTEVVQKAVVVRGGGIIFTKGLKNAMVTLLDVRCIC